MTGVCVSPCLRFGSACRRFLTLFLLPALLASCVPRASAPASAAAFSFALIGDAPYSRFEEPRVAQLLDEINDDAGIRFVLHAGDIKGSSEPCTDALLRSRLEQLHRVQTALLLTPGDNEWIDCHLAAAGRFKPLERLATLRRLAYPDPRRSLGQRPLAVQTQADQAGFAEFVENTRFASGDIVFMAIHVVGSSNGLEPWRGIDRNDRAAAPRADRMAEFERRQAANLAWLEQGFAAAAAEQAAGVVILMQANMRFELPAADARRAGFNAVIDRLHALARRFGKPVLLVHGDRHLYWVDRPLADATPPARNLLRVQTFGSPLSGWVKITADPGLIGVFTVQPGQPTTAP